MNAPGHSPLRETLDWGRQSMAAIVDRMLQNADDTLFSMAENTTSDSDRRQLFETMRALRKTAPAILRAFDAGLHPEAQARRQLEDIELKLLDDSAVEQDIVIGRIVSRIESVAKNALWEYAIRLENVPANEGLRTSFEKLRPAEVARSFRASIEVEGLDASTKLILFKLYERQVLADAFPFYDGLNLRLNAAGISSKAISRRPSQPGGTQTPSAPVAMAAAGASAPVYHLPASLKTLLTPSLPRGAELAAATTGALLPNPGGADTQGAPAHGPSDTVLGRIDLQSAGSAQRISLVNQLLEEMGSGWEVSETDALRRLIVPLIRIALSDRQFFGDQHHPARELLSGLTASLDNRGERIQAAESALQGLLTDAEIPAEVAPLAAVDLRRFLLEQRAPRNTTSARLDEARQAAHAQIKFVGSGRDLPAGISAFLAQVWLPLTSALHLRYGGASPEIERTHRLLEKLFGECRWVPGMEDSHMVGEILEDLERELQAIAVPPTLINKAKLLLQEGLIPKDGSRNLLDLETLGARPPRAEAPTSTQASESASPAARSAPRPGYPGDTASWRAAVPPSAWFRIYDRAQDKTLWLSAGIIYPQSQALVFSGFDPEQKLTIDRLHLLADLVSGKAEAVEPTEPQQSAIRLLCLEYERFGQRAPVAQAA